jgi:hypothetical protein
MGIYICGKPGNLPIIIFYIISPEENCASFKFGPKTNPGLIETISNFSSSGRFF